MWLSLEMIQWQQFVNVGPNAKLLWLKQVSQMIHVVTSNLFM
jgi:hypothetical protein